MTARLTMTPLHDLIDDYRLVVRHGVLDRWQGARGAAAAELVRSVVTRPAARRLDECGLCPAFLGLIETDFLEQLPVGPRWAEGHREHTVEWRAFLAATQAPLTDQLERVSQMMEFPEELREVVADLTRDRDFLVAHPGTPASIGHVPLPSWVVEEALDEL